MSTAAIIVIVVVVLAVLLLLALALPRMRARRAEAEREAARTFAYSSANRLDAEVLALEREMAAMTGSPSWRLTAPLRWINRVRRRRAPA